MQPHQEHGHQGVKHTLELVRQWCYWPNMHTEVKEWCNRCQYCTLAKDVPPQAKTFNGREAK